MPGAARIPHPEQVSQPSDPDTEATGPELLFLVELRPASGLPADLARMRRDLASALVRLRRGGVHIHGCESLVLPGDGRCLALVHAPDHATVALACDAVGLLGAPVHEAHRQPDGLPQPADPAAGHA